MGDVHKLFGLPSIVRNTILNKTLLKNYQRNLRSQSVSDDSFSTLGQMLVDSQNNSKRSYLDLITKQISQSHIIFYHEIQYFR